MRVCATSTPEGSTGQINPDVKKDVEKVVDTLSLKDAEKIVVCRCWRSEKVRVPAEHPLSIFLYAR